MGNQTKIDAETVIGLILKASLGTEFSAGKELELPGGARHKFDLVSEDSSVVVEVRTFETSRRRVIGSAQVSDLVREIFLLMAVKGAKRRLLILTERAAFEEFRKTLYAKVAAAEGVEIHCIPVKSKGVELTVKKTAPLMNWFMDAPSSKAGYSVAFGGPPIVIHWPKPPPPPVK